MRWQAEEPAVEEEKESVTEAPQEPEVIKKPAAVDNGEPEEKLINNLINMPLDNEVVTIGDENTMMKDCSLITATYHVDGKLVGKIGVIGPTRMKYGEVTSLMEYLTNNLSESFRLTDGEDKTERNDK